MASPFAISIDIDVLSLGRVNYRMTHAIQQVYTKRNYWTERTLVNYTKLTEEKISKKTISMEMVGQIRINYTKLVNAKVNKRLLGEMMAITRTNVDPNGVRKLAKTLAAISCELLA
jgi:hypothetical protein